MAKCGEKTEVYSRVCGYFRPVSNWNKGKKEEFKDRKTFKSSKRNPAKRSGIRETGIHQQIHVQIRRRDHGEVWGKD